MKLLTGFGTPGTQDFVYFTSLISARTGLAPDWENQFNTVETPIIGSDNFELQITGFSSSRLETTLLFPDRDSYFRLQQKLSKKATLVLISRFTRLRNKVEYRLGHEYEHHDNVVLISLTPQFRVGATLATATFIRSAQGMGVSSV